MTDYALSLLYEKNKNIPLLNNDITNYIKTYTGELKLRNGIFMKQIPKDDPRRSILEKKPKIRFCKTSFINKSLKGFVWWKVNGHFMMITVYTDYLSYQYQLHNRNYNNKMFHEYHYKSNTITSEIV